MTYPSASSTPSGAPDAPEGDVPGSAVPLPTPVTAAPGSGAGLGRSTALMASGTTVSRVLGVVRGAMLVWAIGLTGNSANAFAAANKLPNILYLLVAGGVLNAVLVPQVVRAYKRVDGQAYVDRLLTLGLVLLGGLGLVLTIAAPLLIWVYADFSDPDVMALAVLFAYWCIPQLFFYGLYSLLGQVLNARGSFGPYMWAPVVNNLVSMAGLAVFVAVNGPFESHQGALEDPAWWDGPRIALLAGTFTLGVVAQALVLVIPLYRSGFRYRPRWGFRGVGLRSAGRVAYWTFLGLAIGQVGVWVISRVTTSGNGNNLYDQAFLIFMLPHSIVTVSLMTALFTRLSSSAATQDTAGVRADLSLGLRTVGLFTLLATAVIGVLALPIGRIVFPTAQFQALGDLAPIIVAMVLGLSAFGAWSLTQRIYYAYEDARAMVPIQAAMVAIVIGGTLLGRAVLPSSAWTVGAASALSASYLVGAGLALWNVRRRLHGIDGRRVVVVHLKAALAALVAAGVGMLGMQLLGPVGGWLDALVTCLVLGVVMVLVYLGLLVLLRVKELTVLVGTVTARLRGTRGGRRR